MPKTYSTVPDKATGDVFTEAMWDTYIKDNINNLIVPPMCRLTQSVGTTVNDSTQTKIGFNTESFDTDSMHDTVTNNTRITIQTAGVYLVIGQIVYTANIDTSYQVNFLLNNTTQIAAINGSTNANGGALHLSAIYEFAAADYVELRGFQDNAANTSRTTETAQTFFMACWIGRTS